MSLIREERREDAEAVHAILAAAFGREAEARLVERLRASGKIVCALVAEEKGRVLGHMVFSRIAVESGNGEIPVLALAPLAVMPAFQRLGVGSALVSAGFERCRMERHARVMVVGDPLYYGRFGFVPASRFGLKCPFPVPEEAFMAIELEPGAFAQVSGVVRYGHEFDDL
ncbi:MAG TPA: N-acetyltransferase, partial [Burkholderiales bacterium]|nr:N-acetyltransferase [Burkholderiales bacterium]